MLLESAQLLNTALHLNDADECTFYQPTHKNHPWTKWTARRYDNWVWLFGHMSALGEEFIRRSESDNHATLDKVYNNWLEPFDSHERDEYFRQWFDGSGERTPFPLCMPDEYKQPSDPVQSYRDYYVAEKVPRDWCTWSVEVPDWVFERQQ